MYSILTIIIILAVTFAFVFVGKKVGFTKDVSMIIAGLFLGIAIIDDILLMGNITVIDSLEKIGLIGLMFIAGMESSWSVMYAEKKDSFIIALTASFTPFIICSAIFYLLGAPLITSLIVGICMMITAEATKADVLLELGKLRTKLGSAMMGAGMIDDMLGFISFLGIVYFVQGSFLQYDLIIVGALIAFFIGIFISDRIDKCCRPVRMIREVIDWIFLPFFFISIGTDVDFSAIVTNPWLVVLVISIAILTKILGTLLAKPWTDFDFKQLYLVGWGMNSRGAVELVIALLAFEAGLITSEIYSSLVIMAVFTTILFPFVFTYIINKNPKIMK